MATSDITPRGSDRLPALAHASVADAMHVGVISCSPDTDLVTVARLMATHHIHAVVVSGIARDRSGEHLTWGLVSDLDVVGAALDPYETAVAGDLAATEVIAVEPQEPLMRAAHLMAEHQLAHLLVVSRKSGSPVGIISTLDIAGCLAWGEA
jgi:CBS domain-containing protein